MAEVRDMQTFFDLQLLQEQRIKLLAEQVSELTAQKNYWKQRYLGEIEVIGDSR